MESTKFLTPKEVRGLLRISAATFHRLCSTGSLTSIRVGGSGHYRVSEDALREFLAHNSTKKKED